MLRSGSNPRLRCGPEYTAQGRNVLSPLRQILKIFHWQGIPWPGAVLYNAVSAGAIFQRHYEMIAQDVLQYCSAGALLDIGTGPGWLLLKLHRAAPKLQIIGLDCSATMVAQARRNVQKAGLADVLDIRAGEASHLPFADANFAVVVSSGSIHHWKEATAALNEIHRVLKPGGLALIYDLVGDTPKAVRRDAAREFGKLKIYLLWLHAFSEPFYSYRNFHLLAEPTHFRECQTKFLGVMFCLILRKA